MIRDLLLTCSDCGEEFSFTTADQAFFQEHDYSTPKRCKACRLVRRNNQGDRASVLQGTPVICSGCGQPTTVPFVPRENRPVFCRACYVARKGSGDSQARQRAWA